MIAQSKKKKIVTICIKINNRKCNINVIYTFIYVIYMYVCMCVYICVYKCAFPTLCFDAGVYI